MDKVIIYSDLDRRYGIGQNNQDTLKAMTFGAGQRFYFLDAAAFRIEFKNRSYVEQRGGINSRRLLGR